MGEAYCLRGEIELSDTYVAIHTHGELTEACSVPAALSHRAFLERISKDRCIRTMRFPFIHYMDYNYFQSYLSLIQVLYASHFTGISRAIFDHCAHGG